MSFVPGDPYPVDPALLVGPVAPPRRRRWVVALVSVLTAAALAVSGLSTWAIWQLPTGPATLVPRVPSARGGSGETAVEAQAGQILARRGKAVLTRDKATFLADLDPTLPALRTQQEQIFDGLAKLDFAQFSYRTNGVAFDPSGFGTRRPATTYVAGVLASYQLRGYDTGLVVEPMAVTFVQRDHRWWVSSDRDVDDQLPAAGHAEPWDDGQVGVAKGQHCLVIGQARDNVTLQRVAQSVDQAVAADLKFWPAGNGQTRWDGRVVVYVPTQQREFTSLFRGSKQTADGVVAVAIPVYDHAYFDADSNGHPYGKVTGSRIIINPKYFRPKSSFFAVTLRHEVSHVAAQPITKSGTPSWLVEGLAEYVGWRQPNPAQTFFARGVDGQTAAQLNARSFRLVLPSSNSFYLGSSATISAHYTAGFLVCAYIQHRYGESKLKLFAARMGAASSPSRENAVLKSALSRTFGLSQTGLQNAVTSWMRGFTVHRR